MLYTTAMAAAPASSQIMVLMFTDLVGSVSLKRRLGAEEYARKLRRHDELFHQALAQVPHGRVLNDTGDGFLAGCDSPSDGIQVALAFQAKLRSESWGGHPFRARVGLHVGQVAEIEEGIGGGGARSKIVGLAADLAARVMSLGDGDQILMTRPIFDDARQYVREHPVGPDGARPELEWMAHGQYEMYGVDDPVDVFEVGAKGFAKLVAPTDSEKARRVVSREEAELLGWRPAAGLEIPRRPGWIIEWKLGEGGFGDVWLARNDRTDERRVFKFCFDVDKLRSLKREMTMFRLIRRALGDRPDIARLHEVQLDSPPFFLESEFTEQGDMKGWAEKRGGLDQVGRATRIDLVARVAEAVAAAHSVGILHKDIKPSNILITLAKDGRPLPRLADFGIAALAEGASPAGDVTMEGFTESLDVAISGGTMMSGTRMYAPPETLAGKPFTLEGDVYALGVLLYQVTVGDLSRPLAPGWERDVDDPLLVEDIAATVDGDPRRRLKSAAELATRLENLDVRRAERAELDARAVRERKRGRLLRLATIGVAGLFLISGTVFWALLREKGLRKESEEARFEAERARGEAERERDRAKRAEERAALEAERARTEAAVADAVNAFLNDDLLGAVRPEDQGIDVPMRQVLRIASERIEEKFEGQPAVEASIRTTLGRTYTSLGGFDEAAPHLLRAVELSDVEGADSERRLLARELLGTLYTLMGRFREAEPLLVEVLEARRKVPEAERSERKVWASLTALGRLRTEQGRYREAEELLLRAREGREERLGEDDPESIASNQELAYLYRVWGRYDESLPIQRRVLEACDRVLDP
ncbi:MAG: tetratricopeptide repeat protein, partial [Planctomycetota bacterium JB042]